MYPEERPAIASTVEDLDASGDRYPLVDESEVAVAITHMVTVNAPGFNSADHGTVILVWRAAVNCRYPDVAVGGLSDATPFKNIADDAKLPMCRGRRTLTPCSGGALELILLHVCDAVKAVVLQNANP